MDKEIWGRVAESVWAFVCGGLVGFFVCAIVAGAKLDQRDKQFQTLQEQVYRMDGVVQGYREIQADITGMVKFCLEGEP